MTNNPTNIVNLPVRKKEPAEKEKAPEVSYWKQPGTQKWLQQQADSIVAYYHGQLMKERQEAVKDLKKEMVRMLSGEKMPKRRKEHLDRLLEQSLYFMLYDARTLRKSLNDVLKDLPS